MTAPSDNDLREAVGRMLRESEHRLDELSIARLRAARRRALAATPRTRIPWRLAAGLAAGGLVLGLAGLVWFQTSPEPPIAATAETTVADIDLLATESPDFYSDLEFYRWLASRPDAS